MNDVMYAILVQTGSYATVMILILLAIAFLQRGFFWKFIKVRTSFGKLLLIKRRCITRDDFYYGEIIDGFLIFKDKKEGKKYNARIAFNQDDYRAIYRCIGVNWIDINEEKNSICTVDYRPVPGFDTKKYSDLLVRALQQPVLTSGQEKLVLFILFLLVLIGLGAIYMGYISYDMAKAVNELVPTVCKGTITAVTGGA